MTGMKEAHHADVSVGDVPTANGCPQRAQRGVTRRGGWRLFGIKGLAGAASILAVLLSASCDSTTSETSTSPETTTSQTPATDPTALWKESATAARAAEILSLTDGVERVRQFAELLQNTDVSEAPAIGEVFEVSIRDLGDVEMAVFAEWWTTADPEAAWQWTDAHWRFDSPRVISTVVRTFSRQDPIAAYRFGFENRRLGGSPFFRDELIDAVIVGWVESGQPGVVDFILVKMTDPSKLQRALRSLGRAKVVTLGAVPALDWAMASPITDPTIRNYLVVNVASAAADQEPEVVAKYIASEEAKGHEFPGVHHRIAARWARYDPVEAMKWVASLEDENVREQGAEGAATNWFSKDPEGAFAWFESREFEPWMEPMANHYFRTKLAAATPETDWQELIEVRATPIQSDNIRWGVIALTLQRWVAHDEEAAEAWIDAHPDVLPDRYVESVRSMPDKQKERFRAEAADNSEKPASS